MKILKIGRYIDNDVVINDRTVERNHIQITRHDDGHYTLLDLHSSNGTFINGKRVEGEVELHYDDVIKIGNTTLRWEDYFPDDEREKLRRELEALKKESCPPPPPVAMCYCRPPGGWEDNGTVDTSIAITDHFAPVVILWGPRDCGKTMTLIRLTRYLESQGYWVEPDRLFRPSYDEHYISICENYMQMCHSVYVPDTMPFMLIKVRERSGRPLCQIIKLPGELCFDSKSSINTPPYNSLINTLLSIPNRRTWVFITELNWEDSKTRSTYAAYIGKLLPSIRKDQIIFTCNKMDKYNVLFLANGQPNIKQLLRNVRDQYPNIFNLLENKKSIIRIFKKWNFDFVPFSSGEFTLTGDDRVCYIPSPDYYPRMLWKAIIKALRNNGKSEIGILGILALAILGFTIGLLITRFLL